MDIKDKLLGKDFPLRDEKGNIVSSRPITAVYDMQNMAGFAISLSEDKDGLILMGYRQAKELIGE